MALTVDDDATLDDIDETLGWLAGLSHRDWSAIDRLLDARLERTRDAV